MNRSLVFLACAASLGAQTATKSPTKSPAKRAPVATKAAPEPPIPLPSEPGEYAVFETTKGRIIVKLFEKEAPITVTNFVSLARGTKQFTDEKTRQVVKRPFYNGLIFHRVIPGFMIQGGDPLGNGMGGGGVPTIPDEFVDTIKFDMPGRLAMANVGRPHTGSVQFFITDGTPEYLNGKHTIFGQVMEGQDVVKAIAMVPRSADDKPETPVVIQKLLIRRVADPNAPPPSPSKAKASTAKKKA